MNAIIVLVSLILSLGKITTNINTKPVKPIETQPAVTIYIFRGNGCPHCTHAVEYFNAHRREDVDVVTYEVWYNKNNKDLYTKVASEFDLNARSVPFIIVGDKYYFIGFSNGDEIMNAAIKETENENYVDLVQKIIKENNIDNVTATSLEEAIAEET